MQLQWEAQLRWQHKQRLRLTVFPMTPFITDLELWARIIAAPALSGQLWTSGCISPQKHEYKSAHSNVPNFISSSAPPPPQPHYSLRYLPCRPLHLLPFLREHPIYAHLRLSSSSLTLLHLLPRLSLPHRYTYIYTMNRASASKPRSSGKAARKGSSSGTRRSGATGRSERSGRSGGNMASPSVPPFSTMGAPSLSQSMTTAMPSEVSYTMAPHGSGAAVGVANAFVRKTSTGSQMKNTQKKHSTLKKNRSQS